MITWERTSVKKAVRRYKLGYALGTMLCVIGVMALLTVVWRTWPQIASSPDPAAVFWTALWEQQLSLISGVDVKLMYFLVLAATTLTSGALVLAYSSQRFFLPGNVMKLQCPFCKRFWHARYDRGQVLCPHCQHLIHPRMIEE
jgi:hypothetical protein